MEELNWIKEYDSLVDSLAERLSAELQKENGWDKWICDATARLAIQEWATLPKEWASAPITSVVTGG